MKKQGTMLTVVLILLRLSIFVMIVIGMYELGRFSYTFGYGIVSDTAMEPEPGRDVKVSFTDDVTAKSLAKLLERRGLVKDADVFCIQLKINKYEEKLEPGDYVLNTSMTPTQMMQVMSGETEEEE